MNATFPQLGAPSLLLNSAPSYHHLVLPDPSPALLIIPLPALPFPPVPSFSHPLRSRRLLLLISLLQLLPLLDPGTVPPPRFLLVLCVLLALPVLVLLLLPPQGSILFQY